MNNTPLDHLINTRALTTFKAIDEELKLHSQKNYLFDLSYLNVLNVEGDKALDFLQGQLTCDIRTLSDTQMVQGAQCNLKGRVLALMDILNWQGIKMVLPRDLIEATINSLNKTALLSRVALKTNTPLCVFGFYLRSQNDILPESSFFPDALHGQNDTTHGCCYHLGAGFYIFLMPSEHALEIKKHFIEKNQLLGSLTWHTLRLTQGQIDIYPQSRGLFLPHRLGLQNTSYLSFNKGCYKGQEIIARMHYKATVKHELKIYEVKTLQKIHSGQKLIKENEGIEVGELIDFSMLSKNHYLVTVSLLKNSSPFVFFEGHDTPLALSETPGHSLP